MSAISAADRSMFLLLTQPASQVVQDTVLESDVLEEFRLYTGTAAWMRVRNWQVTGRVVGAVGGALAAGAAGALAGAGIATIMAGPPLAAAAIAGAISATAGGTKGVIVADAIVRGRKDRIQKNLQYKPWLVVHKILPLLARHAAAAGDSLLHHRGLPLKTASGSLFIEPFRVRGVLQERAEIPDETPDIFFDPFYHSHIIVRVQLALAVRAKEGHATDPLLKRVMHIAEGVLGHYRNTYFERMIDRLEDETEEVHANRVHRLTEILKIFENRFDPDWVGDPT